MKRSPEMQEMVDSVAEKLFGRKPTAKCCVICGSTAVKPEDFRDNLSRREFEISRMCQKCQDETFVDIPEEALW